MTLRFVRWFRRIFAVIFFVAISAQFLDVYHQLPDIWYEYHPTKAQLFPSLLNLLGTGSVLAGAAFITVSVVTLIFGRAYCSFLCPFGILMDFVRWLATYPTKSKFLKSTKLGAFCKQNFARITFSPAWNKVRAFFVGITILLIAFGGAALVGLIEPYSLFGKIFGCIVYPAASAGTNEISNFLAARGNYSVPSVSGHAEVALPAFGLALFILCAIFLLSAVRGRLYCNTVCPVGGYLGFLARYSLFKLELNPAKCIACGLCEKICKAQCIDSRRRNLDFSRCVLCLDCASTCRKSAVHFTWRYRSAKKEEPLSEIEEEKSPVSSSAQRTMDRRAFVKTLPAFAALFGMAAKVKEGQPLPKPEDSNKPYVILPDASPYYVDGKRPDKRLTPLPGSRSLERFFSKCTGCQICVSTCKSQMLKPSITEWGLGGIMRPFMDFDKGFCVQECIECTKVCPSDALIPLTVEEKKLEKLGTAIFREDLCVVKKDETDCSACGEHCPVAAIEMLPYKPEKHLYIPYIHEDVCIGCGACENICPVVPYKALVIQGSNHIRKAKVFDDSMRLYVPEETKPTETESAEPIDADNPFPF